MSDPNIPPVRVPFKEALRLAVGMEVMLDLLGQGLLDLRGHKDPELMELAKRVRRRAEICERREKRRVYRVQGGEE